MKTGRIHNGHTAQFERTEGGGYVATCSCRWVDLRSYADVDVAIASATVHIMYPELDDEWAYRPDGDNHDGVAAH